MLPEKGIAGFLIICLAIFYGVNLHNLRKYGKVKRGVKYRAEVEHPRGLIFALAAFGTILFFIESTLYPVLVILNLHEVLIHSWLQLQFPFDSLVQIVGVFLTAFGYFLSIWSVLARGRYATSWEMPENHKLVTGGPYRYVRHPSYLAYLILFTGLFLMLLNLIAAIPFVAVPGYIKIVDIEEKLLTERFGEEYLQYQQTTGRFFPKRKKKMRV